MIDKDDRKREHDRDDGILQVLTAIERNMSGSAASNGIEDTITPLRLASTNAVLAAFAADDLAEQDAEQRLALLLGIRDFLARKSLNPIDATAIAGHLNPAGGDVTPPPDRLQAQALRRVWLALVSDVRFAMQGGS
jgi:hypothetical protein